MTQNGLFGLTDEQFIQLTRWAQVLGQVYHDGLKPVALFVENADGDQHAIDEFGEPVS